VRIVLFIVGLIVTLNGLVWALQGAYVVPASFMRGPEWIAIGAGVFALGLFILWRSMTPRAQQEPSATSPP